MIRAYLLAGLMVGVMSAHAEKVGFQTIVLEWPDGYRAESTDDRLHLSGPHGEEVTVLQFSLDEGVDPEEAKTKTETLRRYAEEEMPKTAAEQGSSVVRDLKKTDFDERHTLYSMVSQRGEGQALQYLVEYFLVGVKGGAYFSIVGNGDGLAATGIFDPVFAAVEWKD